MTRFRTTKVTTSVLLSQTITLFWFVQADEEQRRSIVSALNETIDKHVEENPELKKKRIGSAPWLRNYTASLEDVFDTMYNFSMGEAHLLAIDAQSLEDESLLVVHCVNEKEPELGRATRYDAIGVLLKDKLFQYTIAEAFDKRPWTRIPIRARDPEPAAFVDVTEYILPSHIPSNTKLQEDRIILFSLIKLSNEEISVLRQNMEDATDEITIYNWPHNIPASQAETYSIFQCIKPEKPNARGRAFVMFIDATHLLGPERAPVVVVACEPSSDDIDVCNRETQLEAIRHKHICLHAEEAQLVKPLWPLIWYPPNKDSAAESHFLSYGGNSRRVDDWNNPVHLYRARWIAAPGLPVPAMGPMSPDYIVFVLCPVDAEELRKLQALFVTRNGHLGQLVELDILPREADPEQEDETRQPFSLPSKTSLESLLEFFDNPAYRAIADPPDMFVFLDNTAIDDIFADTSANPSVPFASRIYHFHEDPDAEETPGYEFANVALDDGLESMLANVGGNMWFWEIVGSYSDDMDVVFWPEYRGSMTREMLDIEWEWS